MTGGQKVRYDDGARDQRLRDAWAPPAGQHAGEPARARGLLWLLVAVPLAIVALPVLAGLALVLGGLASEDFAWDTEDGPDFASTSLAEGYRTSEDLTADVRRVLVAEGHPGQEVVCPAAPLDAVPVSVACSGTVAGWERVSVNLHEGGRFTVVGSTTGGQPPW